MSKYFITIINFINNSFYYTINFSGNT